MYDVPAVRADRLQRPVLTPAGHVGDALAADIEADRPEHHVGDAVDGDLGALAPVLLVADTERVRERAHHPVAGSIGDDDLPRLRIAPAARAALGQLAHLHAVTGLLGQAAQRLEQLPVASPQPCPMRRPRRPRAPSLSTVGSISSVRSASCCSLRRSCSTGWRSTATRCW